MADALSSNPTLTELQLFRNDLGLEGGKALAEALKVNSVLTKLCVMCNFGDAEKQLLWDALEGREGFELKL